MNSRDTMTSIPIGPRPTYGFCIQGGKREISRLSDEEEKRLWRRDSDTSTGSSQMNRLEKMEEGLEAEGFRYVRREGERARVERRTKAVGIMRTVEVSISR